MQTIYRLFVVVTEIRGTLLGALSREGSPAGVRELMDQADAARSELWQALETTNHDRFRRADLPHTSLLVGNVASSEDWIACSAATRRVARMAAEVALLD